LNKSTSGKVSGNEQTIFLDDEVSSSKVDDSHTWFKGRRNPPKWQFG
jgi:hypothetical protein